MSYSSYGLMALLVYLIIDRDVLFKGHAETMSQTHRTYRRFLLGVIGYIATDILWGMLDQLGLVALLYADTVVYYIAMAASVLFWTRYVISYLNERHGFEAALRWAGNSFFAAVVTVSVVNLFQPILFWIDASCTYHPAIMRHTFLIVQVSLFLLTAVYTLLIARQPKGPARNRQQAIGLFGLAMAVLIAAQYLFPLLPLYSAGCLIGGCVLHSFVVEDEREEYLAGLEMLLDRELQHKEELERAMTLANTDALTGLRSKRAYAEVEERLERSIVAGTAGEFGLAVFDLNGLKHVNDTLGHEAGDAHIIAACKLICDCFRHSPVFRTGGDEFVALLEGEDLQHREELLAAFDRQAEENLASGKPVVSTGMAVFDASLDNSYHAVFKRADQRMYLRKDALKQMGAHVRE